MTLRGLKRNSGNPNAYKSFLNINSALDKRCSNPRHEGFIDRTLEVVGNPTILDDNPEGHIIIRIKTVTNPETQKHFKIIFKGDKLDDMFDASKIEVTEEQIALAQATTAETLPNNASSDIARITNFEQAISHNAWKNKLAGSGQRSLSYVSEILLWNYRAKFESFAKNRGFNNFLEYLDAIDKKPVYELWKEHEDLDAYFAEEMSMFTAQKESGFFRIQRQLIWFYARLRELINSRKQLNSRNAIVIDDIGLGLFQEPLTILAIIRSAYEAENVTLNDIPLEMHLFDKDASIYELFNTNNLVYPLSLITESGDKFEKILTSNNNNDNKVMQLEWERIAKNFVNLFVAPAPTGSGYSIVGINKNNREWAPWLKCFTFEGRYATERPNHSAQFVFMNNLLRYLDEKSNGEVVNTLKNRCDANTVVFEIDLFSQEKVPALTSISDIHVGAYRISGNGISETARESSSDALLKSAGTERTSQITHIVHDIFAREPNISLPDLITRVGERLPIPPGSSVELTYPNLKADVWEACLVPRPSVGNASSSSASQRCGVENKKGLEVVLQAFRSSNFAERLREKLGKEHVLDVGSRWEIYHEGKHSWPAQYPEVILERISADRAYLYYNDGKYVKEDTAEKIQCTPRDVIVKGEGRLPEDYIVIDSSREISLDAFLQEKGMALKNINGWDPYSLEHNLDMRVFSGSKITVVSPHRLFGVYVNDTDVVGKVEQHRTGNREKKDLPINSSLEGVSILLAHFHPGQDINEMYLSHADIRAIFDERLRVPKEELDKHPISALIMNYSEEGRLFVFRAGLDIKETYADICQIIRDNSNASARKAVLKYFDIYDVNIGNGNIQLVESPAVPAMTQQPTTPKEEIKPNDIFIANELLLLNRVSHYLRDYPVDETIDLSLIPKEDLEANMKTWAYIIALNNKHGLNVNYIFESDDEAYKTEAKKVLFEKIEEIKGIDMEKVKAHVADTYRPGALQIHIMKKEDLEKLKDIPEGVLPVALSEGTTLDGTPLRDFMSASVIGLAQAAVKKMRIENNPHFLEIIEQEILPRMQHIYQRLFPDKDIKEIVTKETLLNMIDDNPIVRKNLAIALALPPIIRAAIQYLKDYHDRIHLLQEAA